MDEIFGDEDRDADGNASDGVGLPPLQPTVVKAEVPPEHIQAESAGAPAPAGAPPSLEDLMRSVQCTTTRSLGRWRRWQ